MLLGLASLGLLAAQGGVLAAVEAPIKRYEFQTDWQIQGTKADDNAQATVALRSGDLFMKRRLLPPRAARLDAPLVGAKGEELLPSGTELFGTKSDSADIYCSTAQKGAGIATQFLLGFGRTGQKQRCLIDTDRDNDFDGHFKVAGEIKGLPSLYTRTPKTLDSLDGLKYSSIDPVEMVQKYFVAVEYQGKPLLYDRRNFTVTFGTDEKKESLTSWIYTKGSIYPQTLTYLGGQFTVLNEDQGVLNVRIDRQMPSQPFGVIKSVSFR
jgi:hypothetical protein